MNKIIMVVVSILIGLAFIPIINNFIASTITWEEVTHYNTITNYNDGLSFTTNEFYFYLDNMDHVSSVNCSDNLECTYIPNTPEDYDYSIYGDNLIFVVRVGEDIIIMIDYDSNNIDYNEYGAYDLTGWSTIIDYFVISYLIPIETPPHPLVSLIPILAVLVIIAGSVIYLKRY